MRRSRLNKRTEKKTRKTIFLSILGIIFIIFLLYKFGLELLVNFSFFITGFKNQQTDSTQNEINFISAPVLNPIRQATNSSHILITGKADKNRGIYLFINNSQVDQTSADDKGSFKFTEELEKGNNQINAKVIFNNKESDFSNSLYITYQTLEPKLDISTPTDGQQFKKDQNTVVVSGKTDPSVTVTVNGFWAVIDENNNFSYTLSLRNGDNDIKIIATDQAGNTSEKNLKVNYSQ